MFHGAYKMLPEAIQQSFQILPLPQLQSRQDIPNDRQTKLQNLLQGRHLQDWKAVRHESSPAVPKF